MVIESAKAAVRFKRNFEARFSTAKSSLCPVLSAEIRPKRFREVILFVRPPWSFRNKAYKFQCVNA
jgi:hypothetical protein